jgi:hypothetical protein
MRSAIVYSLSIVLCLAAAACDDAPKTYPTEPTNPIGGPTSGVNTLQLVNASITPGLGVVGLTTITAHVEARQSNGNPLSYAWTSSSKATVGDKPDYTFTAGDVYGPLTATISDGRGGTVSVQLPFINASLSSSFDGHIGDGNTSTGYFSLRLTQTGTKVTGSGYLDTSTSESHTATIDPAQPGTIDAEGHFTFRLKVESTDDITLTGDLMLPPKGGPSYYGGYLARGQVVSGPFAGQPFVFSVHDPY